MIVFETKMSTHSYSVYNAVYAVAQALQALYSSINKQRSRMTLKILKQESWKVNFLLRVVQDISLYLLMQQIYFILLILVRCLGSEILLP